MAGSLLSAQFLDTACLDTIVPLASNADITELLVSSNHEERGPVKSLLPSIEQRPLLFFGKAILLILTTLCLTHMQTNR